MKILTPLLPCCLLALAHAESLVVETPMISLSAVKGKPSISMHLKLRNTGKTTLTLSGELRGRDGAAFRVEGLGELVTAGQTKDLQVHLEPIRGKDLYEAELVIDGTMVPLRGIGLDAFEGKNEPPLDWIVKTLGIPLEVGGTKLELDVKPEAIGEGAAVKRFKSIPGTKAKITPLARFSPPGETPFGWVVKEGEPKEIGVLGDSTKRADNHQCLFPSLKGNPTSISFDAPAEAFAIYMKGHLYTAFTDASLPTQAKIPHTIRVYPVREFQGQKMDNCYLIACEEASNGDYQDAVFLLEHVTPE
jgi:hypothetical protein